MDEPAHIHILEEGLEILKNLELRMGEKYFNLLFDSNNFGEILLADYLDHEWNQDRNGIDALTNDGLKCEYKVSFQTGQEEKWHFGGAEIEKIEQNDLFFFAVRKGCSITHCLEVPKEALMELLKYKHLNSKQKTTKPNLTVTIKQLKDRGAKPV